MDGRCMWRTFEYIVTERHIQHFHFCGKVPLSWMLLVTQTFHVLESWPKFDEESYRYVSWSHFTFLIYACVPFASGGGGGGVILNCMLDSDAVAVPRELGVGGGGVTMFCTSLFLFILRWRYSIFLLEISRTAKNQPSVQNLNFKLADHCGQYNLD